jgi:hypothetical protein
MKRPTLERLLVLPALLVIGCGSGSHSYALDVGGDDAGGGLVLATVDGGSGGPLDAYIEQGTIHVTFVAVSCSGGCASVEAVGTGGYPPYTYLWENGSTSALRTICPTASASYSVKVTDTGTSGELARPPATVQVPLSAGVMVCPDGGSADAGVESGPVGCGAPNTVCWTTWASSTPGQPGSATGTIATPQGPILVTYAGEVYQPLVPTTANLFTPVSTYTCSTVVDAPNPTIVIQNGGTQIVDTLTFSAPVKNPVFAIMSLGNSTFGLDGTYDFGSFDESFTILKEGMGYMAGPGTLTDVDGGLVGDDGDGLVQLNGTFTTIEWLDPIGELTGDHGFTVGVPAQ